MRIFKTKLFNGWAKDIRLSDDAIRTAAQEIAAGNYEASLGKKVYKKRIAIGNKGKSGSTRNIVAYQAGNHVFFMYGFAKGEKANISPKEKIAFQKIAENYYTYTNKALAIAVKEKKLFEVLEVENNG